MTAPAAGVVEGGTGPAALHGLGVDHDHRGDRVALVLDPHPAEHQVTVEVLAEARKDGRARMGVVPGQTIAVLIPFIAARIETGATIRTDGWKGYLGLERAGFAHERIVHQRGWVERGERSTPYADEAISAAKRR